MFIAPFTRLTTLDMSDATRLGAKEAAHQARLLRMPEHAENPAGPHDAEAALQAKGEKSA
jgi:hypothetical protein